MTQTADYTDETQILDAVWRRDEGAFAAFVDRYHGSLIRLARLHVPDRATAEEVVKDTWLGVLTGIDRFEGRSSLKTWLFRILTNVAKTHGVRENRSLPFSTFWEAEAEPFEPAVAADRFRPSDDPQWPHQWAFEPITGGDHPEERLLSNEAQAVIGRAIEALPPAEGARFEAHLTGCDSCARYLEQMRLTITAAGRLTEETLKPAARDNLLQLFRDWKAGESR